ncbi:alpha-adducin-like [Sycon ciliatum]|uniref:alpha-adducin-like n=1 Tax=Sycon ciliatum TaxID=27933 RepID=UPI0031F656FF
MASRQKSASKTMWERQGSREHLQLQHEVSRISKRRRVCAVLESSQFRGHLEDIVSRRYPSGRPAAENGHQGLELSEDESDDSRDASASESEDLQPQVKTRQRGMQQSMRSRHSMVRQQQQQQQQHVRCIDDIDQNASKVFGKEDVLARRKLATLYRIVDQCGWSQGIYNHITVRINSTRDEFLLNPYGLRYDEITASSLVKVDAEGNVINEGSTRLGINKKGFALHSMIHSIRPDAQCVIHVQTPAGNAISAMGVGLLPICQEAMIVGKVAYHQLRGTPDNGRERRQLATDLGSSSKVMIVHNHGLVAMGRTIDEALYYMFHLVKACETQVCALGSGVAIEKLIIPDHTAQQLFIIPDHTAQQLVMKGSSNVATPDHSTCPEWSIGELEFEALARDLDGKGYKTGLALRTSSIVNAGVQADYTRSSKTQERHDHAEADCSQQNGAWEFLDGEQIHDRRAMPAQPTAMQQHLHTPTTMTRDHQQLDTSTAIVQAQSQSVEMAPTSNMTRVSTSSAGRFAVTQSPLLAAGSDDVQSRRVDVAQSMGGALASLQECVAQARDPGSATAAAPRPRAIIQPRGTAHAQTREQQWYQPITDQPLPNDRAYSLLHPGGSGAADDQLEDDSLYLDLHEDDDSPTSTYLGYSDALHQTTEIAENVAISTSRAASRALSRSSGDAN